MSTYPPNKPLIGAVAALFLGAGVFTATSLAAKEQLSDLTLANIEAMTRQTTKETCDASNMNPCYIGNSKGTGALIVITTVDEN